MLSFLPPPLRGALAGVRCVPGVLPAWPELPGACGSSAAAGAEYSTVAAVLRELAHDPDGWIDLLGPARGERADLSPWLPLIAP